MENSAFMQRNEFIRAAVFRLPFLFYDNRQNQQNTKNNTQKIILKYLKFRMNAQNIFFAIYFL